MPTLLRHYDVMQGVLQNPTKNNAQPNIFLIGSCALNFKINFTFIYLESVSSYVNWKLSYMLRKGRHCKNNV